MSDPPTAQEPERARDAGARKGTAFEVFQRTVLGPEAVIEAAFGRCLPAVVDRVGTPGPGETGPEYVKANFSRLVDAIQAEAHRVYRVSEQDVGKAALRHIFQGRLREGMTKEEALQIAGEAFSDINDLLLSISQSRKSRAGGAFEEILKRLFRRLGYPFVEQPKIDGKPDFLMPSLEQYERNPMDSLVFTAKRTVRERWKQIIAEGKQGLGFFLATIDDAVPATTLQGMLRNRVWLVVPRGVKDRVAAYGKADNVMSFEEFFRDHLDVASARWRAKRLPSEG